MDVDNVNHSFLIGINEDIQDFTQYKYFLAHVGGTTDKFILFLCTDSRCEKMFYWRDGNGVVQCSFQDIDNNELSYKKYSVKSSNNSEWGETGTVFSGIDYCLISNINIYNTDNTLFFQRTPITLLSQVMDKVEMSTTLSEIIKILPTILVVVVFFLGLRKGLQTLLQVLHRA